MPPKKRDNSRQQNRPNNTNRPNNHNNQRPNPNPNPNPQNKNNNQPKKKDQPNTQSKQNNFKQNKNPVAQLPKFITFNKNNFTHDSNLSNNWPLDKTFVVDFYPRAQVPVTYINSANTQKLQKHLHEHEQEIVLVDIDWTNSNPLSIFEICSKKGVLLIHNSGKSDLICNFLKKTHFYTKGSFKVQRLNKYVNTIKKLQVTDIDEEYILPKRYPRSFDYLLRLFLGEPNFNFRPKSIRSSDFSKIGLTCSQVMCCAYKVVSEFMLIPIVQSAPKIIGEIMSVPKSLEPCYQIPFQFDKYKITKVTFIPDDEEEKEFILPMIEKLYDGKAFVIGSLNDDIFGYGTSNGILITQKEIAKFKHANIPMSEDAVDEQKEKDIIKRIQWSQNLDIIHLAIKIHFTLKANKGRPRDPFKGTAKFPSFAKYKPARFETPSDIPHREIQLKFTILQLPINPDLYVHFALPVLESIQALQEAGFDIPQAHSFDIDEMCESVRIDDISDELEENIHSLIDSFRKVNHNKLIDLLRDIEPKSREEDAYERIIESDSLKDLDESDVSSLLSILNRVFKQRNLYITRLSSIHAKKDDEMNLIMNKLLVAINPSDKLVEKINLILSKYNINTEEYEAKLKKVERRIMKMSINDDIKQELINNYNQTVAKLMQFIPKHEDCFDQVQLIFKALLNLRYFDSKNASPEEINLFINNANNMMSAAKIYIHFMLSHKYKPIQIIENLLFKLVFTPSENTAFTQVYAVYQMHNKFIFNENPFANFKSSTGSGKTRCAPFIFAIKALMDRMEHPFFVMTQPGASIISDKMKDFANVLGENNVILVNNIHDMMKLYKKGKPSKPVVALFSPHNALRLLVEAEKAGIDIISKTRFCLDEIHERSVDTDVFIAKLSEQMLKKPTFPLQVLMMSATPDARVLNCFGNVKTFELPDSFLFPIDTIKTEVEAKNKVSEEAAIQTTGILKQMAHGTKQLGHILIFTSGNSRINEITMKVSDKIREAKKELQREINSMNKRNTKVITDDDDDDSDAEDEHHHIVRNIKMINDIPLTDVKLFNQRVNETVKDDNTTLFIILIKFAGFVPSAQKEIAKNVIKNHENVIKIILATNAIESSITIDQLSAVVDTGIFNQPQFDTQRGLTRLSEEPISLQSQTQRKGRVGRVRPGTSVQISIKNHPFKEFLPPEIQTTDISSNILSLRKIGIKLESIKNLPDPIDPQALKMFMKELYSIGAIDKSTGELTESGLKISQFESLSPFLAASIMNAASSYKNNRDLLEVLGSLIVLIFNSSDLVIDPFAEALQNNFDENSDIVTLLKTFLDLVLVKSWKLKAAKYGLNGKIVMAIFSTTNTITENLKVNHEEKNIFIQLKEIIKKIDLMDFIQKIINSIESFKSSWIQCRKATFMTIDYIINNPSFIYFGDRSLAFSDEASQSEIIISARPGSKGLISPGAAYVFNISHNESMSINFGSCIHRNLKDDPIEANETYKFVRPKILEADISLYAQEEFSSCLLNVLLQGNENGFRTFNALKHTGIESGKIFFYPTMYKGKCIYTYAPMNKNSNAVFEKALNKASMLLPYTPSTILVRHQLLNCAIAIRFLTIDKPNSSVYFFKENDCYPYQVNKDTLNFMLKNVDDLCCADNQTFIAITGEMLSIPFDSENTVSFDSIRRPTIDPKCNYVFSDDPYFYSHMVILSDKKIPGQTPITWTKSAIYADYAPTDYITKIANGIFPDLLSVKECSKLIFFHNGRVNIEGNYPPVVGSETFYYGQNMANRPIDAMFDRFAMGCIDTYKLAKNVDLRSFEVNGPKIQRNLIRYNSLRKAMQGITYEGYQNEYTKNSAYFQAVEYRKNNPNDYQNTISSINSLKSRRSEIISQQSANSKTDWPSLSYEERQSLKSAQSSLRSERSSIESEIQSLNMHLASIKIPPKPELDPKYVEVFKIIHSPDQFLMAQKLLENQFHITEINKKGEIALSIPSSMNNAEKTNYINSFVNILRPFCPLDQYIKEEVPLYEIIFNHAKNSQLTQEEFTTRIQNVCNKFGAIISSVSKYRETNSGKNPTVQGQIYVFMYSAIFTIPLASMVSDEIFGKNSAVLRIPINLSIDPFALSRNANMIKIMKDWLISNDLEIQLTRNKWVGPKQDVEKAIELLQSSPPIFPTKTVSIPGGVDIISLSSTLKKEAKTGKKKWYVNLLRKTITCPSDTSDEDVKEFIDKYKQIGTQINDDLDIDEDEILGDVNCCGEESVLSTKLINLYNNITKKIQTKNFCRSCIRESLVFSLGKMFDENNDTPLMNQIYENTDYIQPIPLLFSKEDCVSIPLGQLIWGFIADLDIATPARTYITAIALQTLRKSPFITFCPQHPSIIFRKPPFHSELKCIVSGCNFILCSSCNKWHAQGNCPEKQPIPLGDRVCPYCHAVIEKSMACNHLHCNCGKHFCYYCGAGPWDDSGACYDHLSTEHGGYSNDPPDYRKYIKKDNRVTEKDLEEFYAQYPQWRNFKV